MEKVNWTGKNMVKMFAKKVFRDFRENLDKTRWKCTTFDETGMFVSQPRDCKFNCKLTICFFDNFATEIPTMTGFDPKQANGRFLRRKVLNYFLTSIVLVL